MDPTRNPYAPGAGTPPPLMAGRDSLVQTATHALARAKGGRAAKSFVAVGLRGVGKTVILNKAQDLADAHGYQSAFMEAHDDSSLVQLLVPNLRRILFRLDRLQLAQDVVRRGLRVLKSFAVGVQVRYAGVEVGLDLDGETGTADSGQLAADLPELMLAVGQAAASCNTAVALLLDEIQYLASDELGALIMAIHRINQKQLPVVLVAAGLPQVLARMGESKSYAERLFDFPRVDALETDDACMAIRQPAEAEGVVFEQTALDEIIRVTGRYPYFLQEWGYVTWNMAPTAHITRDVVLKAESETIRRLDASFFRVRLERMTPTEKKYMRSMAELGPGPHRSGDIARIYKAAVTTVAPIRSSLIAKGMIYSPAHGDTAFTAPLFDQFMRREIPTA